MTRLTVESVQDTAVSVLAGEIDAIASAQDTVRNVAKTAMQTTLNGGPERVARLLAAVASHYATHMQDGRKYLNAMTVCEEAQDFVDQWQEAKDAGDHEAADRRKLDVQACISLLAQVAPRSIRKDDEATRKVRALMTICRAVNQTEITATPWAEGAEEAIAAIKTKENEAAVRKEKARATALAAAKAATVETPTQAQLPAPDEAPQDTTPTA